MFECQRQRGVHGRMSVRRICLIVWVTLLCEAVGLRAELPPLIPRAVLFGNPDRANPQISPNGSQLAYLAPSDGVLNVWVRSVGEDDDRLLTHEGERGIQRYFWAQNSAQILYLKDQGGDLERHLYSIGLADGKVRDLTPYEGVSARVVAINARFPDEILVALNRRDPQLHDVYRVDLTTGDARLDVKNDGAFVAWTADHELRVRAGVQLTPDGGTALLVRDTVTDPWRTLTTWEPSDVLNSGPITFTPDGNGVFLSSSAGSDTGEFRRIELDGGRETTLVFSRNADLADLFIHPIRNTVQAVAFNKQRLHWTVLDRSVKRDFRTLRRLRRGDFSIINRDHADRTWLIAYTTDNGPVYYYAYDRHTRQAKLLFSNRKALEGVRLARMVPISFRARDGLTIPGYLTVPRGIEPLRLPLVVLVHPGPWSRDTWGYNGTAQWLANRGYAVLQINYRGSTGYGKSFVNAANKEWGGKMNDDLVDGVRWAVGRKIADAKRIAIFGASYGGYAALASLAFTPDVYSCGISVSGPCDLTSFAQRLPSFMKLLEPLLWDRIGHPVHDAKLLRSRSPFEHADKIRKPLLIAQGANDQRVPKAQTVAFVAKLREANRSVTYVEYADEAHGIRLPKNRLDFFGKAEKFLAEHLGGRFEP